MSDKNASKYLKYAIGEILLVMVGILLALQVNNWNEQRKAQNNEIKLVNQLLEDAKADSVFFNSRLDIQRAFDSLFINLIAKSKDIDNDSLGSLSAFTDPFFFRLAYQSNLINNNPDAYKQISNDSIKVKLREYNAIYEYVAVAIELANRINEEYGVPLMIHYDSDIENLPDDLHIEDFRFALIDPDAVAKFKLFHGYTKNYGAQIEQFLEVNKQLITQLKHYLKEQK